MNKIKVTVTNHSVHYSDQYLSKQVGLTFLKKFNNTESKIALAEQLLDYNDYSTDVLENCLKYGHDSILEQVSYTIVIEGASRSFLSQITRHRLFSFISGSQHYIDYSKIGGFEIPLELLNETEEIKDIYNTSLQNSMKDYNKLIELGVDHSVARQVLPNAMRNNLIVTGNLREWRSFINLRMCGRNTSEIYAIAYSIYKELEKYNPLVMKYTGPDCKITVRGKCTQGSKSCEVIFNENKLEEKFKILKEIEE